jgi:Tripartite tricarboxylate transporter family receptor
MRRRVLLAALPATLTAPSALRAQVPAVVFNRPIRLIDLIVMVPPPASCRTARCEASPSRASIGWQASRRCRPSRNSPGRLRTAAPGRACCCRPPTPPALVARWETELRAAMPMSKIARKVAELGAENRMDGPEAFNRWLEAEITTWGAIIRANNISLD